MALVVVLISVSAGLALPVPVEPADGPFEIPATATLDQLNTVPVVLLIGV